MYAVPLSNVMYSLRFLIDFFILIRRTSKSYKRTSILWTIIRKQRHRMKRSIAFGKIITQKCFSCVVRRSWKSQLQEFILPPFRNRLQRNSWQREIRYFRVVLCLIIKTSLREKFVIRQMHIRYTPHAHVIRHIETLSAYHLSGISRGIFLGKWNCTIHLQGNGWVWAVSFVWNHCDSAAVKISGPKPHNALLLP